MTARCTPCPRTSPRYDLELEPISLMRSGRAEFQLAAMPTDNLLAMLCIDDPTPQKIAALEHAGVQVTMTLVDHESARTSVKRGYLMADWSPTPESWKQAPADFEGVWFRPERPLTGLHAHDRGRARPPTRDAAGHQRHAARAGRRVWDALKRRRRRMRPSHVNLGILHRFVPEAVTFYRTGSPSWMEEPRRSRTANLRDSPGAVVGWRKRGHSFPRRFRCGCSCTS